MCVPAYGLINTLQQYGLFIIAYLYQGNILLYSQILALYLMLLTNYRIVRGHGYESFYARTYILIPNLVRYQRKVPLPAQHGD